jgi:hypothetical protein
LTNHKFSELQIENLSEKNNVLVYNTLYISDPSVANPTVYTELPIALPKIKVNA